MFVAVQTDLTMTRDVGKAEEQQTIIWYHLRIADLLTWNNYRSSMCIRGYSLWAGVCFWNFKRSFQTSKQHQTTMFFFAATQILVFCSDMPGASAWAEAAFEDGLAFDFKIVWRCFQSIKEFVRFDGFSHGAKPSFFFFNSFFIYKNLDTSGREHREKGHIAHQCRPSSKW